ncbi:MAG: Uncharacterized MFS-type transporter, partial [uncultured Corynebacteriales bacterium]
GADHRLGGHHARQAVHLVDDHVRSHLPGVPRRHRGQRGLPRAGRGLPRDIGVDPVLGRQRVRGALRRAADRGRPAGRRARPAQAVRRLRAAVHHRLAGLRDRPLDGVPHRGPRAAGRRRRRHDPGLARHRAARHGPGAPDGRDRHLERRRLDGGRGRTGHRRPARGVHELARGLLHQHPDRPAGRRGRAQAADQRPPDGQPGAGPAGLAGPHHRHRPHGRRPDQGHRLGLVRAVHHRQHRRRCPAHPLRRPALPDPGGPGGRHLAVEEPRVRLGQRRVPAGRRGDVRLAAHRPAVRHLGLGLLDPGGRAGGHPGRGHLGHRLDHRRQAGHPAGPAPRDRRRHAALRRQRLGDVRGDRRGAGVPHRLAVGRPGRRGRARHDHDRAVHGVGAGGAAAEVRHRRRAQHHRPPARRRPRHRRGGRGAGRPRRRRPARLPRVLPADRDPRARRRDRRAAPAPQVRGRPGPGPDGRRRTGPGRQGGRREHL